MNFLMELFVFSGRFNRAQYASALLAGYLVPFGLFLATESWVRANGYDLLTFGFIIVMLWVFFASLAKRMRDVNKSGWFALSVLIPILGQLVPFIMLFYPGDHGSNNFGSPS